VSEPVWYKGFSPRWTGTGTPLSLLLHATGTPLSLLLHATAA
jgi:hypothetical protein